MMRHTVPWYPELATAYVPELPGMALQFIWMAAILSRKVGAVTAEEFEAELKLLFRPFKESTNDLTTGSMRMAEVLGLIVFTRGLVLPGAALLSMRPWWEQ